MGGNGCLPFRIEYYGNIPSYCYKRPRIKPCNPLEDAWYYDHRAGICKKADSKVCGAGNNLFKYLEACNQICKRSKTMPKFCLKPPLFGSCNPILQTWRRFPHSSYCKRLNYTICNMWLKEFATEEKCMVVCLREKHPMVVCSLSPSPAPCSTLRSRKWYFDAHRNECFHFPHGKCANNNNGFSTQAKCLERCRCEYA
ncbi:papilin-like [Rhipicephalus sanguineus]|uniref:papilin-like n=1 Tax=Rhipicephalus sanguineus TaxID=34632 RepID=UPI0020C4C2E5|nr:papilin-like [Rhipicephalus sanguineus]